jgi:hypothetical protein
MARQFEKHYTREEVRALLPEIRHRLDRLLEVRRELEKLERRIEGLMSPGCDMGGKLINSWTRSLAEIKAQLWHFYQREILIKDLERGLVDFPAIIGGDEVFLCWEKDEEDIEFWHDLNSGYAGRQKLKQEE